MYSFESRIRFSETGEGGRLTPAGLLAYFQDCVTFHAMEVGMPHAVLSERELAWVILQWQVEMKKMPQVGDRVKVGTTPYRFGGFAGLRGFEMTDDQGRVLARADSMWAMMSTGSARPTRVPEDVAKAYGTGTFEPLAWKAPALEKKSAYEKEEETPVRAEMLDVNGHVNNVWYLRLAQAAAEGEEWTKLCVAYKKSALPGDVMRIGVCREEDGVQVDVFDENRNPYAMVWFGK